MGAGAPHRLGSSNKMCVDNGWGFVMAGVVSTTIPRRYLTSAEAAVFAGYRSVSAIRKAVERGALVPAGRRGRTYTFAIEELERFMTGRSPVEVSGGQLGVEMRSE